VVYSLVIAHKLIIKSMCCEKDAAAHRSRTNGHRKAARGDPQRRH
jgi:hypothetical protein